MGLIIDIMGFGASDICDYSVGHPFGALTLHAKLGVFSKDFLS
jgi:hypothetical protein